MYLIAILFLALAVITKRLIRSPKSIGKAGENKVAGILHLLPREYRVINNVIIPHQRGTSQIDHIVLSPYGIFVIETKNYSGWIFGDEKSESWKQTFRTTHGYFFYNPIKQNWGHVYALSNYLQLDKWIFIPIVVFSNEAKLNTDTETPVVNMRRLKRHILTYKKQIMSADDVAFIYDKIINSNLFGQENEKKHINAVRSNVAERQTALRNGKCPKCGNNLVLRNGKYGPFYGCANYPKCKFTKSIS